MSGDKLQAITLKIRPEIDMRFRLMVLLVKGKDRGALSESIEEAIELWIKKKEEEGYKLQFDQPE